MLEVMIEVIGWSAAAMMLGAYLLLTARRITPDSRVYHWLNLLAGLGFVINSGWNHAYPSAAINVVWAVIAIYGLAPLHGRKPRGA